MALLAQQTSALDGFHYLVSDATGKQVGELAWPMLAQATNARLRWYSDASRLGEVQITCGTQRWGIQFEYLERGWVNDVRFTLAAGGVALASAELRFGPGRIGKRGQVTILKPIAARLVRRRGWLRHCYVFEVGGHEVGQIEDSSWLTRVRKMTIDLPPELDTPTQLFVFFLVMHLVQTQA